MRSPIAILLLLFILPGCTRLQTFRVVDARSGEPLDGVQGERLEGSLRPSKIPLILENRLSPDEAQTSNASGSIAFEKPGAKFMFNPSSKNPEYSEACVTTSPSGAKILYPDEYREISVKPSKGVVEIPLRSRELDKPAPYPKSM
jgi:hypothetical protein